MKIKIALRGTLVKYFDGSKEDREVEVLENCTCDEALRSVGMDYTKIKSFGFVAINGKRVMIYDRLKEGDQLKAYSRISGG
jgi:hypothetical protein